MSILNSKRSLRTVAVFCAIAQAACGSAVDLDWSDLRDGAAGATPASGGIAWASELENLRAQPIGFTRGATLGTLPGEASIDSRGEARYSVPIEPAAGVRGMVPRISIDYGHRGGNGLLGVGFTISGFPSIGRCMASAAQDGAFEDLSFDEHDPLCMDGERLVLVSGSPGRNGAEYRRRRDPFDRIRLRGDLSSPDSQFEVYAKDGRISSYGGAEARLVHPYLERPYLWGIRRVEDRYGNWIEYEYQPDEPGWEPADDSGDGQSADDTTDDAGEPPPIADINHVLLPESISYAGVNYSPGDIRSIGFEYTQRDDVTHGFFKGAPYIQENRLHRITVFGPGNERLRDYRFRYDADHFTGHSLLSELQLCDRTSTCLPPTVFTWEEPEYPHTVFQDPELFGSVPLTPGNRLAASAMLSLVGDFGALPRDIHDEDHGDELLVWSPLASDPAWWAVGFNQASHVLLPTPQILPPNNSRIEARINQYLDTEPFDLTPWIMPRTEVPGVLRSLIAYEMSRFQPNMPFFAAAFGTGKHAILGVYRGDGISEDAFGHAFGERIILDGFGWSSSLSFDDGSGDHIYHMVPIDHDGRGGTDLWLCMGEGPKTLEWVLALNYGGTPGAAANGFEFHRSSIACTVYDDYTVVRRDHTPKQSLLISPAYATDPDALPDPDEMSAEEYVAAAPVPQDDRTLGYRAIQFEPGEGPGSLSESLVPLDRYQRFHDPLCRNGLAEQLVGTPLFTAGMSADKPIDVNGDGLLDFFRFQLLDDSAANLAEIRHGLPTNMWGAGTVCADSMDDVQGGQIRMFINTGDGFVDGGRLMEFSGPAHPNYALNYLGSQLFDVNVDGLVDLLLPSGGSEDPGWRVLISRGDGQFERRDLPFPDSWWNYSGSEDWRYDVYRATGRILAMDSPGGYTSLEFIGPPDEARDDWGPVSSWLAPNRHHERIVAINNGLGALTEFDYGYADPGAGGWLRPKRELLVATELRHQRNPNQEESYGERYEYEDPQVDADGRGLLGFRRIIRTWGRRSPEIIPQTQGSQTNDYDFSYDSTLHDYPRASIPTRTVTRELGTSISGAELETTVVIRRIDVHAEQRLGGHTYWVHVGEANEYVGRDRDNPYPGCFTCATPDEPGFSAHVAHEQILETRDDFGTITGRYVTDNDGWSSGISYADFADDESSWLLGLPRNIYELHCAPGAGCSDRETHVSYDPTTGEVQTRTLEPNQVQQRLQTTYEPDEFGNVHRVTATANGLPPRITETVFSSDGAFPMSSTNPEGHTSHIITHRGTGLVVATVDPNGVTEKRQYDSFYRLLSRRTHASPMGQADNGETYAYVPGPTDLDVPIAYRVEKQVLGGNREWVDHAVTGQVVRRMWYGMAASAPLSSGSSIPAGTRVYTLTKYDTRGAVREQSLPTWEGQQPAGWTVIVRDDRQRLLREIAPDGKTTSYEYELESQYGPLSGVALSRRGLSRTYVTDEDGRRSINIYDGSGRLMRSIDAAGIHTCFERDPFDNLRLVTQNCNELKLPSADQTERTFAYQHDEYGRLRSTTDSTVGTTTYHVNPFGEIEQHTDPDGSIATMIYDRLGRLDTRIDDDGETSFAYDNQRLGLLDSSTSPDGIVSEVRYGAYSRVTEEATTIDGVRYDTDYTYTVGGNVETIKYPWVDAGTPVTVRQVWDNAGYNRGVVHSATGQLLWFAREANAAGQITREQYANQTTTRTGFDTYTGNPTSIRTTGSNNIDLQMLFYDWYIGNSSNRTRELHARRDLLNSQFESYSYDAVGRLRTVTANSGPAQSVHDTQYNVFGDITQRTGVGQCRYDAAGRLDSYGPTGTETDIAYDQNSSIRTHGSQTLSYSSLGLVRSITSSGLTRTFRFDAAGNRVVRSSGSSTISLGVEYQRNLTSLGVATSARISPTNAAGRVIAQLRVTLGPLARTPVWDYVHQDFLGSGALITNSTGTSGTEVSYSAWGEARDPDDWTAVPRSELALRTVGFTGHRADTESGMIDMGWRMYDPRLGRFMSPDPVISDALSGSAYNRYSYVQNRPLRAVDPDGRNTSGEAVNEESWTKTQNGKGEDTYVHSTGVQGESDTGYWSQITFYYPLNGFGDVGPVGGFWGGQGVSIRGDGHYGRIVSDRELLARTAHRADLFAYQYFTARHAQAKAAAAIQKSKNPFENLIAFGGLFDSATEVTLEYGKYVPGPVGVVVGAIDAGVHAGDAAAEGDYTGAAVEILSGAPLGSGPGALGARLRRMAAEGAAGGERAGKSFTRAGKREVRTDNAAAHGGQTTCTNCGQATVPAQQSRRGVTPPGNETHVDHIIPKSKNGNGSPDNGQVLCRDCNLSKGDD